MPASQTVPQPALHPGPLLPRLRRYFVELLGLAPSAAPREEHGQDIRLACAIGLPFAISFSVFNLTHGFPELGIIEGLALLLLPPAYYLSHLSGRMLLLAETMVMLCVITIFLALFHYGGIHNTGIYWVFSLPLTAFYVTGQCRGWLWSLALIIMTRVIPPTPDFTATHLSHFQFAILYYTAISASFNLLRTKSTVKLHNLASELAAALRELKETQAQIAQSEKMAAIGQLVAGVAHEVNNTTNFITGALPPMEKRLADLAALLKNTCTGRQFDEQHVAKLLRSIDVLLGNIREGARRSCKIVTDLKNFSRPDDDQQRPLDINQGLLSTLSLVTPEYKYQMEIIRDFAPDLPRVYGSQGQINQVFMNLLINAFQAQTGKGRLLVRTLNRGNKIHIILKDDGPGIPKEIQGRIFEPFFTTKEVGKGTGLGLSVSYGIIRKHRGEILVRSEPGQGTEFEIILPAGREPGETKGREDVA